MSATPHPAPLPRPQPRGWRGRAALGAAGLLLALGCGEIALRLAGFSDPLFFQYDPVLGVRHRPGSSGWWTREGRTWVTFGPHGLREPEPGQRPEPGVYRVAFLGDSMTESLQVPVEQSFPAQFAQRLNAAADPGGPRCEALNFGVSGYSTAQELLQLDAQVWPYAPAAVVLVLYVGNDLRDNVRALAEDPIRPFFQWDGGPLVPDSSFVTHPKYVRENRPLWRALFAANARLRTVQLAKTVRRHLRERSLPQASPPAPPAPGGAPGALPADLQEAMALTLRIVVRMQECVQARHARFLVAIASSADQVHPDPAVRAHLPATWGMPGDFVIERALAEQCRVAGVDAVLLGPALRALAERTGVFLHGFPNSGMGEGHWNADGHRAVAAVLANHFRAAPGRAPAAPAP